MREREEIEKRDSQEWRRRKKEKNLGDKVRSVSGIIFFLLLLPLRSPRSSSTFVLPEKRQKRSKTCLGTEKKQSKARKFSHLCSGRGEGGRGKKKDRGSPPAPPDIQRGRRKQEQEARITIKPRKREREREREIKREEVEGLSPREEQRELLSLRAVIIKKKREEGGNRRGVFPRKFPSHLGSLPVVSRARVCGGGGRGGGGNSRRSS